MKDETISTLDSLMTQWKLYQKAKLNMENAFPCSVVCGANKLYNVKLTFVSEHQNNYLKFCCPNGFTLIVNINELNGFNLNRNLIELTRIPELLMDNVIMEFSTPKVATAILKMLENFGVPMQQSSPSSDSSIV
ncbi:hypothetical protein RN001_015667 [Aquatica leii]|uniref:Uncharacterized protein n=1 Tax=Aquatica leii TaxID=1421715 RepID=A0AAN7SK04_9COLE|nr:hypothetical protein RN001_015667 [Aquatica leii]